MVYPFNGILVSNIKEQTIDKHNLNLLQKHNDDWSMSQKITYYISLFTYFWKDEEIRRCHRLQRRDDNYSISMRQFGDDEIVHYIDYDGD
jgi:hypothetical protein